MKLLDRMFRTEADTPAPRYPDRKSRVRLLTLGGIALVLALAAIIFRVCSGQERRLAHTLSQIYPEGEACHTVRAPQGTGIKTFKTAAAEWDQTRRGDLILVNRQHPCTPQKEDGLVQLLTLPGEDYFVRDWNVRLEQHAAEKLEQAMAAARKKGVPRAVLADRGYRTAEEQARAVEQYYELSSGAAFDRPEKEVLQVCAPNASDYQTGLSVHLSVYGGGEADTLSQYGDVCRAMEEAGFVLRYPKEKEPVTLVKANAGQFRYVGTAHAALMNAEHWCLEDYIGALKKAEKENRALTVKTKDASYCIYRVTADEKKPTAVPVPDGLPYTLSGDNCGGIIVTVTLNQGK